jgi:peptidase M15-like protein
MNVSENFTLEELTQSQTAARLGLDNTPNQDVILRLENLCEIILEPARAQFGPLLISSGYRSPDVNAAVGGSRGSAHMLGNAADVIPLHATKLDLARWVKNTVPFDQVILEFGSLAEPAWTHVSADPRQRKMVLRILPDGKGYQPATI